MDKQCTRCSEVKPETDFYVRSGSRSKMCSSCENARSRTYHAKNSDSRNKQIKEYRDANRDELNRKKREFYASNTKEVLDKKKEYRAKKSSKQHRREYDERNREKFKATSRAWAKANPEKSLAKCAKRRADKVKATPPWFEKTEVEALYKESSRLTNDTHVDHIIPLRHSLVCGLHCIANLQIIEASVNMKKSNKFVPTERNAVQRHDR